MKKIIIILLFIFLVVCLRSQSYCNQESAESLLDSVIIDSDKNDAAKVSGDEWAKRQGRRNGYERKGWQLAEQGRYEEAIANFIMAVDSSLIVQEHEKAFAIGSIVKIYEREGKFEEALKVHQWFMGRHGNPTDGACEKRIELLALIEARDTKSNKPIYDYIGYLKTKYSKYFPPNGYLPGISGWLINDLIHLYDYMHDYDAGIAFMDEIIKYHTNHKDPNHRSAHAKDVREYTRVKQAWELDKKTDQHGHLKEVIRTSDVISW